jgi:hypothetical protein
MTSRDGRGAVRARWGLLAIGALAAGVTAAIYLAGRLLQPDYTFSLFGANPIPGKSALATVALALLSPPLRQPPGPGRSRLLESCYGHVPALPLACQ